MVKKMAGCSLETPPDSIGTSMTLARENPVMLGGRSRMILLPMAKSSSPRYMLNVASVTINVGSLKREIKKALIMPSPRPIIAEITNAIQSGASGM